MIPFVFLAVWGRSASLWALRDYPMGSVVSMFHPMRNLLLLLLFEFFSGCPFIWPPPHTDALGRPAYAAHHIDVMAPFPPSIIAQPSISRAQGPEMMSQSNKPIRRNVSLMIPACKVCTLGHLYRYLLKLSILSWPFRRLAHWISPTSPAPKR